MKTVLLPTRFYVHLVLQASDISSFTSNRQAK
jgi:hypothetical protein